MHFFSEANIEKYSRTECTLLDNRICTIRFEVNFAKPIFQVCSIHREIQLKLSANRVASLFYLLSFVIALPHSVLSCTSDEYSFVF